MSPKMCHRITTMPTTRLNFQNTITSQIRTRSSYDKKSTYIEDRYTKTKSEKKTLTRFLVTKKKALMLIALLILAGLSNSKGLNLES